MEYITLDDIKTHLRLDDITAEDTYLEEVGDAAESLGLSKIHRSTEELTEMGTAAVRQFKFLALQLCEDIYDQRGLSNTTQMHISPAADSIICSLRKLSV
jgi:hypothetical protein